MLGFARLLLYSYLFALKPSLGDLSLWVLENKFKFTLSTPFKIQ